MSTLINPRYAGIAYTAMAATGAAAAAVFTPFESIKIIGLTVLTGVSYGIANDMIACRDCIEYFTIEHRYFGQDLAYRPLLTLNPNLNALAWGMIATWHVCAIAGVILAGIARVPFPILASKITARQLAPCMAIGAALIMLVAHVKSRSAQAAMIKNPTHKYFNVPIEFQAGWEACNIRNSIGYAGIAVGGAALIVAMIASRAGLIKL